MTNLLNMFQAWWSSISQREQRLVVVCGVFGLIGLIYWGVLQPINARAEQAQLRIQSEKQLLSWVSLVDWLTFLKEKQGIEVEFMDIDRGKESGLVEVNRLQFKRG